MISSIVGYFFKQDGDSKNGNVDNNFDKHNNGRKEDEEEEEEESENEESSEEEEDVVYFKEESRKLREVKELENELEEECSEEEFQNQQTVIKERLIRAKQIHKDISEYPKHKKAKESSLRRLNALLESEVNFIKKMDNGALKISPARIKSTNLAHLQAILYTLYHPNFINVCDTRHPIHSKSDTTAGKKKLTIDIVCCTNTVWFSIVARNAKHLMWSSESYGSRSGIKRKTMELLEFGMQQTPRPSIVLCLPIDISDLVISKLKSRFSAIEIWADHSFEQQGNDYRGRYFSIGYPDDDQDGSHLEKLNEAFNLEKEFESPIQYVNLDTSTLVALSSDVCNGKLDHIFHKGKEHIIEEFGQGGYKFLATQTNEERMDPVIPSVMSIIQGKTVVVTRKAKLHFENILSLIGTESEKEKAKEILEKAKVMEEMEEFREVKISERVANLPASKTINPMQKEVFGKADSIPNMITSTSNRGFIRAARQSNVHLRVAFHGSRALLTKKYEPLSLSSSLDH